MAEITIHAQREPPTCRLEKEDAAMYQVLVYPITANLWRWEIRCCGSLLRCGTAPTRAAAETAANHLVNT